MYETLGFKSGGHHSSGFDLDWTFDNRFMTLTVNFAKISFYIWFKILVNYCNRIALDFTQFSETGNGMQGLSGGKIRKICKILNISAVCCERRLKIFSVKKQRLLQIRKSCFAKLRHPNYLLLLYL